MLMSVTSRSIILSCLLIVACIPGCMAFSDSSAMRIEVEVYKGPLSLEPEIQLQELYGYLLEAHTGVLRTCGFTAMFEGDIVWKGNISTGTFDTVQNDAILLLGQLEEHILNLEGSRSTGFRQDCKPVSEDKSKEDKGLLEQFGRNRATTKTVASINAANLSAILTGISKTAASMQVMAFRYAMASTAGQPSYPPARIAATFFIQAVSEYGNQLEARADALLKQLGEYGRDRRELPLSTHLREAEPTDFLHLFEWMDGHIPRWLDYLYLNFSPDVPERVKIVERLYADHFWSKINTVYASGRGKTQMAFIKDETGNWNLKSFANDPTELLEAYANVAKKALQKAAEIAAGAATGGGSSASLLLAKQLRDFAAETEPDKAISQASPAGSLSLVDLRTRLADKLDPTQFNPDFEKETELVKKVKGKAEDAAKEAGGSDKQTSAAMALTDARKELAQHRQQVVARWEAIFNDHSNLVDILSSTMKKK